MSTSRRMPLAAAVDRTIAELVRQSEEANAALMRGDAGTYRALVAPAGDFVLMSPFGGRPTRGSGHTEETWEAIGRFFRNGTFRQELVQAYGTADMAALVVIEHAHVEAGGLPPQAWSLRVTLVYRRDATVWRLVHRHADPLVAPITIAQSAALAGDVPSS